jgi:hypothetical protein
MIDQQIDDAIRPDEASILVSLTNSSLLGEAELGYLVS